MHKFRLQSLQGCLCCFTSSYGLLLCSFYIFVFFVNFEFIFRHIFDEDEAVHGTIQCYAFVSEKGNFPPAYVKLVRKVYIILWHVKTCDVVMWSSRIERVWAKMERSMRLLTWANSLLTACLVLTAINYSFHVTSSSTLPTQTSAHLPRLCLRAQSITSHLNEALHSLKQDFPTFFKYRFFPSHSCCSFIDFYPLMTSHVELAGGCGIQRISRSGVWPWPSCSSFDPVGTGSCCNSSGHHWQTRTNIFGFEWSSARRRLHNCNSPSPCSVLSFIAPSDFHMICYRDVMLQVVSTQDQSVRYGVHLLTNETGDSIKIVPNFTQQGVRRTLMLQMFNFPYCTSAQRLHINMFFSGSWGSAYPRVGLPRRARTCAHSVHPCCVEWACAGKQDWRSWSDVSSFRTSRSKRQHPRKFGALRWRHRVLFHER